MQPAAIPSSSPATPPAAVSARSDERERELLACVALRDRQAFEELYVLYHRPLARFLMRLSLRYELAEEVINDTFWVVWRQAARSLIGLIPVWGLVPKIAVAYGGTYTTGVAAWRWYENGEVVSSDQLKRISREAIAIGRARATELIARARSASAQAATRARTGGGILSWLRSLLPGQRKPRQLTPPDQKHES